MRFALLVALVLLTAAAEVTPLDGLADETAAQAASAVAELHARGDVAVTVRAGRGARAAAVQRLLADRVVRALGGKVVLLPDASAAAVQKAGFAVWIEVGWDVAEPDVRVSLRVWRLGLSWREWLATPASRRGRARALTRHLDAGLRRGLGLAAPGPRAFARPKRLELDLDAPVLALAATDLDGDGQAELIALTSDEVVLLTVQKTSLVPRQRVALAGAAPLPRPREPLGTLLAADLDGDGVAELLARSSEHDAGVRLAWRGGQLVDDGVVADFPMCAKSGMTLAPGQNLYVVPRVGTVAYAACAPDGSLATVDAAGAFRHAGVALEGVGAAFALADLDGDGVVELAASANRAPGDGDVLTVLSAGKKLWASEPLSAGIVAVTAGDADGDGALDVIFAARLVGATRTDVWIVR